MTTINEDFDPIAWANIHTSEAVNTNSEPAKKGYPLPSSAGSTMTDIEKVVKMIIETNRDITSGYENWRNLGFALAHEMGEGGRQMYHDLSRMNSQYTPKECDKQYDACLRSNGNGITIASFFHMAKEAGIDIGEVVRETRKQDHQPICVEDARDMVCAKSAKVPTGTNNENSMKINKSANFENKMPSGTLALLALSDETTGNGTYTFSDKIKRENLPSFLHPIYDSQNDAVGRDKMLLGTLNIISGILPKSLYGIYDRKKVFASLYTILYGSFATSKGDLEACKEIIHPIKAEMRRKYEEEKAEYEEAKALWETIGKKEKGPEPKEPTLRTPYVTANSSASAVYRGLDANDGWGVMFETEADTLTNMLSRSEYGDYSDLLRKAHHHESIAMVRVSDHINIEIDKPRLSVFLTCTGSQIPLLLPASNVSNGLASRFLFYALPNAKVEFRNVFESNDNPIEDIYQELGNSLTPLYHALKMREEHPLQFILSKEQQGEFVSTFDEVLKEQFSMLGEGIKGFIFRIALECFRFAMILTVLHRLSECHKGESIFDDDEQAILCNDTDFHTAMAIIHCLVNHTARVYSVLGNKDDDPFNKIQEKPSDELKRFFAALPEGREFKTCEAMDMARSMNLAERSAKRYLGDLITKYQLLGRPKHGTYIKCKNSKNDSE